MDAHLCIDPGTAKLNRPPSLSTDELARNNWRLVHKIARQVFNRVSSSVTYEDLVQIGHIAMIEAARSFVDRGTAQFSTYATLRVRGAMIDELRKSATISRGALRRRREFGKARQELQTTLCRQPSESEMAERVDMAIGAYRSAINSMQSIEYISIDVEYSDCSSCFADLAVGADGILESSRLREAVAVEVARLPEREQLVLQMFFVEECSLEEIGNILDTSASRVCQIKRRTLDKLRSSLCKWSEG